MTAVRVHHGPYAMLHKQIAFMTNRHDTHYLRRAPEIVEDICICFNAAHGIDLRPEFHRRSRPCIVKFFHREPREDALRCALYSLYCAREGDIVTTCFDGEGVPVPATDIRRVEYITF